MSLEKHLVESIVEYFEILNNLEYINGQKIIFPKLSLESTDTRYILKGRYIEKQTSNSNHVYSDDIFIKGNAIDIIGAHIDKADIYSCFGKHDDRHRYLVPFNEKNHVFRRIFDVNIDIEYKYKKGVFIPTIKKITPEKISAVEIPANYEINTLKTKEGFKQEASQIVSIDTAKEIIDKFFI
jgi:hypothetical protein